MALTQRQMACFESNKQFQAEVAAALLLYLIHISEPTRPY